MPAYELGFSHYAHQSRCNPISSETRVCLSAFIDFLPEFSQLKLFPRVLWIMSSTPKKSLKIWNKNVFDMIVEPTINDLLIEH